jgi:hypothetical protein
MGWREALLRAYYGFRLWRNEGAVHAYGIISTTSCFTGVPRVPLASPGTDPQQSLIFIPPEAEAIVGTKQSFAPAPASNARQPVTTS